MRLPDAVFQTLCDERAKFGAIPNAEQLGIILNNTAWAHRGQGFGLSRKDNGAKAPFPGGDPPFIAHDILMLQDGTAWDCLIGAGAEAVPSQGESFVITDPAREWVAPVQPQGQPPPPDLGAVLAKLDDLRGLVSQAIVSAQDAFSEARTAKLAAQGALEQATEAKLAAQSAALKPAPVYKAKLFGATVVLKPE